MRELKEKILAGTAPAAAFISARFGRFLLPLSFLLVFLLGFAITALVNFPDAALRDYVVGAIQQQTGARISIRELSFSPLLTLRARKVSWQPPVKGLAPVIDRFSVSPLWTTLAGDNPAGRFQAVVAGGTISGHIAKDGSGAVVLTGVHPGVILTAGFHFPVTGKIRGNISAERPMDLLKGKTNFKLETADLQIGGLAGLGLAANKLALGNLRLRGRVTGRTLRLEDLRNEGGDLSISGHGTVMLAKMPRRSRLNLRFKMRPGARLKSGSFKELLSLAGLKAGRGGSYNLHITGTLARPILVSAP
jgi:type II secretion system protein N